MVLGFFRQASTDTAAALDRFKDKQTAEAMVAILTGTSFADGELEAAEKKKIIDNFNLNPMLKKFDNGILLSKFNELSSHFTLDIDEGHEACLKELRDISGKPVEQKQAIMRAGAMAAKADGDFEQSERVFLGRCCDVLGLSREDFNL